MTIKSHKYIISNDFYIRSDLYSFMIYFDYFISPNLPLAKFVKNSFVRKFVYRLLRSLIILLFTFRFHKLRYKIASLDENAILIFKGSGKWSNTIKLEKRESRIIVKKTVFSKEVFEKERNFYNKYKKNDSKIFLPKSKFIAPNVIEMEFLKMNNFRKLIVNGTFDFATSLNHFDKIKKELIMLYKEDPTLIHGDLWSTNIFVDKDKYYLIDFSESLINTPYYDFYVFLYSILNAFSFISNNQKSLINNMHKNISILDTLQINQKKLVKIERQFNKYRLNRFS